MSVGSRICIVVDLPQDAMKVARLLLTLGELWPDVPIDRPVARDDVVPVLVGATLVHIEADS